MTNTAGTAFEVSKTYSDGNQTPVDVTLQCTGATVEAPATRSVTPGMATGWNLTGLAAGANCTATEDPASVPPGYTTINDACAAVPVMAGVTASCTIFNDGVAQFEVNKIYTDETQTPVDVTLQCTGATVDSPTIQQVVPGVATSWDLSGVGAAANCTATEDPASVPPGYTTDNSDCQTVPVIADITSSCTITNTANTATVTVEKVFSDDNPAMIDADA